MNASFTVQRLNSSGELSTVSFSRGEYIKAFVSHGHWNEGEITGISMANHEFRIGKGNLWYAFGCAYKTDRPEISRKPTVSLSKAIRTINKKYGSELTEADRIA